MIIIGLCGGSGSGKGTAAHLFLKHGIPSIDADAVYADLIRPGSHLLCLLADAFGKDIVNSVGELDRKHLSSVVFSDKEKLSLLNSITHAEIIKETERRIADYEANGYRAVIFDAPLLFESGFDKKCDFIIAVIASADVRVERLVKRDGISREAAKRRIASQLPEEFLVGRSDFVIRNGGDASELQDQINSIAKSILK